MKKNKINIDGRLGGYKRVYFDYGKITLTSEEAWHGIDWLSKNPEYYWWDFSEKPVKYARGKDDEIISLKIKISNIVTNH